MAAERVGNKSYNLEKNKELIFVPSKMQSSAHFEYIQWSL